MDFETFLQSLFGLFKSGENARLIAYALLACLFTQAVKKLFVNKVKSEIMHKFDVAVVLPFLFGLAFSALDATLVCPVKEFCFKTLYEAAVNAVSIGALATVIFKFCSSLSGQSMKSLLKDDFFGVFYNQLLYFGNAGKQLLSKELSLKDFIAEVKLLSSNSKAIYSSEEESAVKKERLARLLSGVADGIDTACLDVIHNTLLSLAEKEKPKKTE